MFRNKLNKRPLCESHSVVLNIGQIILLLRPFWGCETEQDIETSLKNWIGAENLAHNGTRSPDPSAHNKSTHKLRYPIPRNMSFML